MRVWLLSALLIAVALSGCAGDESPAVADDGVEPTDAVDDGTSTTDMPTSSDDAPVAGNALPVLTASSDVPNGTVPFNVTFTIEGSDADNDTLSWHLVAGNDTVAEGVEVPATATVEITDVGNHTFTIELTDGNATVDQTLVIVGEAAPVATEPLQPYTWEGTVLVSDPMAQDGGFCLIDTFDYAFGFPASGVAGDYYRLPDGVTGWPFVIEGGAMVTFFNPGTPAFGASGTSGTVTSGMTHVMVCSLVPLTDYTLTISPPA